MSIRITWSDNEIALLVDVTLNTIKNPQSYKTNVDGLSKKLREMAVAQGIDIDNKYRNCNGIILQMTKMRYLLTNGKEGLPGASSDFKRIANMYINDHSAFVSLYEESRKMICSNESSLTTLSSTAEFTKSGFIQWLTDNGKTENMVKIYALEIDQCEVFAKKAGYTDFNIYDNSNASSVITKLLEDSDFKIYSLRKQIKPQYALSLYLEYISGKVRNNKEQHSKLNGNDQFWFWLVNVKNISEDIANAYVNALIDAEAIARRNKFTVKKIISSNNVLEVTRTKRKLELFDAYNEKNEKSEFIYTNAINEYIEFLKYAEHNDFKEESYMVSESDNQVIDGNKSIDEVSNVLDIKRNISLAHTSPERITFNGVEWSVKNWTELYVIAMRNIIREYPDKFYCGMNLVGSDCADIADSNSFSFMKAPKQLFNDIYIETNYSATDLVRRIRCALNICAIPLDNVVIEYKSLLKDTSQKKIESTQAQDVCNEEPEQIEIETVREKYDESIINNCNKILEENFEDGYIIGNYMHQMRFISYYEEAFGSAVGKEADELDSMLKIIGNVIEDRVFAAKDGEEMLLDDIASEINTLLDNGASCVYMECVYEKYASRLNSELNIYNSDTLKNVLRNKNKINTKYKFKADRIANKIDDCQSDVKKVLQNSHVSISYDEIKEILWYIPIDAIKLALIHIDGAVWAGPGLYFYAPNFNISSEELSKLTAAMHSEISAKGYLVTKDAVRLFTEKCPSAAIDYSGFKDYLIRNILKWKLSDQFSGSSAIFCEKGVVMDYDEMFRSFAANHSRLTLSEIIEFQHEIDITRIYWNSIMKEMIRISPEELVNKENVHFDIAAIDSILDTMCPGDYEALKNIDIFISFPSIGYKWNGFVLESYLRDYSKLFRLEQMSISSDEFNGVMVRRSSPLKEYNDVAADMLAHNDSWNDEKTALRCLVNEGFQQRAANKKIGEIITKAKHIIRENNS